MVPGAGGVRRIAADRLAVDRVRLAADRVRNTRRRHEIALVGGVDEHLAAVDVALERADRDDAPVLPLDAALASVKELAATNDEPVALLPTFEDLERGGRLERPHRVLALRARALSVRQVVAAFLARPVRLVAVPLRDIPVELERNAAERGLVADVRLAEPARREPPDARLGRDDDRALAHALRLDGGGDRRGRRPVDHDVKIARR